MKTKHDGGPRALSENPLYAPVTTLERNTPFIETLMSWGRTLRDRDDGVTPAGLMFAAADLLRFQSETIDRHHGLVQNADAGDSDEEAPPAPRERKPRAAKSPDAEHRHKFNAQGVCTVDGCGKLKGAGGRPSKQPDAAARTVPLPVVDVQPTPPPRMTQAQLAAAADGYASGGQGSTGTGDGRR